MRSLAQSIATRTIANQTIGGSGPSHSQPPKQSTSKIFVDGPNLVNQYQAMADNGRIKKQGGEIFFEHNTYLWTPIALTTNIIFTSANYYVLVGGKGAKTDKIESNIKGFQLCEDTSRNINFSPVLITKKDLGEDRKNIANKIITDIQTAISEPNWDTIYLFSGNGELLPVLQDAQSNGKQVKIFAFSKDLSPDLIQFGPCILDEYFFEISTKTT